MPEIIAILTARGGSRRVPRKNIRTFSGKPMIAWPITAALASGCFTHVLVSTDDAEIAETAVRYGAEVPFLRPANLSDEYTHAHKAARHMLEWALNQWSDIPYFAHIYPTAALLEPRDIQQGLALLRQGKRFAYTAQKLAFPLYQMVTLQPDGTIVPLFSPEKAAMRSQDMPQGYIDAGQLYWFETQAFLEHELNMTTHAALIELPPERALDIDTDDDWQRAEKMARFLNSQ